jgi:predicted CXXCH cytochrome family protein
MKPNIPVYKALRCLMAVALIGTGAASNIMAAAIPMYAQVQLRPLTPSEITKYGLGTIQKSAGISTLGVGEPVYLDALVNKAVPASTITNVSWTLTSKPVGSLAVLTNSPLGTNIPTYKVADQSFYQVAGRQALWPDAVGKYIVTVTIGTTTNGTTNLTQTITAGTFAGIETCTFCHSGSLTVPNKVVPWSKTLHAQMFSWAIDGGAGTHYSKNFIICHTVGYDTNPRAVNNGFDDVAATNGWVFPAVLTNGNWASIQTNYPTMANLANIQCENCHGPGSQHVFSDNTLGNTNAISVNMGAGDCGQCHDATPNHVKNAEWNNAMHAKRWGLASTGANIAANRIACVRCHTGPGFVDYINNLGSTNAYATNLVFEAITCQSCHEPHDATNPHQLRAPLQITLSDGTVVTNAGFGGFCMNCHQSRNGSVSNSLVQYPLGQPTWNGGSSFGTHDSPQGDMLEGVNAVTYGKAIPSSAHRYALSNTCADCHMQSVATTDPAFAQAGGHTFHMTYNVVTNGITNTLDKVDVCVQCHGPITSFDMVKQDYNGDGITEGVQTEVQHLLDGLSQLLPNSSGVMDGLVKSPSAKTNYSQQFLKAIYNWTFVSMDGSLGVHNASYAVGLLKASITDLTGDPSGIGPNNTNDLAYYLWATTYFGSATSPNAQPNASPSGDGVPNWLKFSSGLNPTVPGVSNYLGGMVFANGKAVGGNTSTNTVSIFMAAEVTFDTAVGSTYTVLECTSLSSGWQPVSPPIAGTGSTVSFLAPTRKNLQQFFRVSHTTP